MNKERKLYLVRASISFKYIVIVEDYEEIHDLIRNHYEEMIKDGDFHISHFSKPIKAVEEIPKNWIDAVPKAKDPIFNLKKLNVKEYLKYLEEQKSGYQLKLFDDC